MTLLIVEVFDWRTVFASGEEAEAAMLAADADDTLSAGGTISFGWVPARPGAYVVARRRGTHELVGYLFEGAAE